MNPRSKFIQKLATSSQKHFISQERGAMLPIIAVVAIVVIFILVGVGFDTTRVKRASSELGRHAEAICRDAAAVAVVQRDAVRRFRNQVNELVATKNSANSTVLSGTTIVDARFIIPTMPSDSSFCPYDNVAGCTSTTPEVSTPSLFNALLNELPADPAPNGPCNLNCAKYPADCRSDCTFLGNINGLAGYPPQLWNNIRIAGNTAAC